VVFFKLLNIDTAFLDEPVAKWSESEFYVVVQATAQQLNVVNDYAERERGVQLAFDFAVNSIMLCKLLKSTDKIIPLFEEKESNCNKESNASP